MVTRGYFSKSASKYSSNKTSDFENYSHRRAILTKIQVFESGISLCHFIVENSIQNFRP